MKYSPLLPSTLISTEPSESVHDAAVTVEVNSRLQVGSCPENRLDHEEV